ncbi:ABC transporter substrate-binding protein [Variovorax sp. J22R24]|uniref:ABC transporter substrate-binding protein n=1 Tax=Variovorax gracilis TaxID=3053502 RepID=UPI00257830F1|nr:ABC transporter substrate-binding protein [Variovorax sp. J22R24]MDM0108723.1 ABC transporter substrate-binding protein [Variovorax sp. J22R24]
MKRLIGLGLALLASLCLAQQSEELMSYAPRGRVPPGYPAAYAATVRAAEDEGRLVIYATTDAVVARPLIADFNAMYPRINVEYEDLTSTELHHRFVAETQLGGGSADVLWSSAMDLQASLVSNGYAETYESPESAGLPAWAKWKGQAWATTFEPIVIAYNRTLLPASEVPRTHADLARLLSASTARLNGKVVTYNIEKSGLGFFLATQDVGVAPVFWDIAQGLGKVDVRFASTTDAMLKDVSSGKAAIAYNVLGSYTVAQARKDTNIGYVFPSDYTLVMSRLQLINKKATNPNAARLWVDYILSRRGQTVIANQAGLYSVRTDVNGETTAARLTQTLGGSLRAITVGPGLIGYLNNQNYRDFIRQWRGAIQNPLGK